MAVDEDELEVATPVHRSLVRENLFMGCEPRVLMLVGCFPVIFIVILQTPLTFILGLLIFFGGIPIIQKLAKRDPLMSEVYMRHFRYRSHYDAVPSQSGRLIEPHSHYKG